MLVFTPVFFFFPLSPHKLFLKEGRVSRPWPYRQQCFPVPAMQASPTGLAPQWCSGDQSQVSPRCWWQVALWTQFSNYRSWLLPPKTSGTLPKLVMAVLCVCVIMVQASTPHQAVFSKRQGLLVLSLSCPQHMALCLAHGGPSVLFVEGRMG